MKKKILTMFAIVFVMAFAAVVYAFNQPSVSAKAAASCCAKTDACPLKNKNAKAENQAKAACCDSENCCCKTDACPMKTKGESASASAENCCASCCGDSCPMKNKQTETAVADQTEKESCQHKTAGI